MRSFPQVTISPLDGSMSMWAMLCFPSWNVANAVRLQRNQHSQTAARETLGDRGDAPDSLLLSDGVKAGVTHSHRELEAHDGERGAFGAAFPTYSLAAFPAVVLRRDKDSR